MLTPDNYYIGIQIKEVLLNNYTILSKESQMLPSRFGGEVAFGILNLEILPVTITVPHGRRWTILCSG